MRISRIRKFKKSGEITIVLTKEEAKCLSFKLYYDRSECHSVSDIVAFEQGKVLGQELYHKGLGQIW